MNQPRKLEFVAVTKHRKHPELKLRKRLLANHLLLRVLARAEVLRIDHDHKLDYLLGEGFSASKAPGGLENGTALDVYLKDIEKELSEKIPASGGDPVSFQALVTGFSSDIRKIECEKCAGPKQKACKGMESDFIIVQNGMKCWEDVFNAFEAAVKIAEDHYARIIPEKLGEQRCAERLEIILETTVAAGNELEARTIFEGDGPEVRKARIVLGLPRDSPQKRHMLHLPYVLFHEIFVHSAEGWLDDSTRRPTTERCGFREGFVDAAAAEVLVRSLRNNRKVLGDFYSDFVKQLAMETKRAHNARIDFPVDANDTDEMRRIAAIIDGRARGDNVFGLIKDKIGLDKAILLATSLNIIAFDQNQRNKLLQLIDYSIDIGSQRSTLWLQHLIDLALKKLYGALKIHVNDELARNDF